MNALDVWCPPGVAAVGLDEIRGGAVPFRVPLAVPFRGLTDRRGLLLCGPAGWGEFSPFPDYSDLAAARWLAAALEAAYLGWPEPVREQVPVSAIVPAVDPGRAAEMALAAGCDTVKIKVGDAGDVQRVAAVREALGPEARIRVDVNGGWDADTAVARLRRMAEYGLDYAEQPCDSRDLAAVRARTGVRIAGDEILRRDRRLEDLSGIIDVAVLKVSPLGGVRPVLRIAERVGVPVVVSSALETSVGLAAEIAAAASVPGLYGACGLGTGRLFAEDTAEPLIARRGRLPVVRRAPRPDLLPVDDPQLWARLERAHAVLTAAARPNRP